jgi:tetratricopeptide (TPR) repeat protein
MAITIDPHFYDPAKQNDIKYKNLIYLAEIYTLSGEIDKSIDCLEKCDYLSDRIDHLYLLADIYLEKGFKNDFFKTTKKLIEKRPQDVNACKLHDLACMMKNIQSVT